VALALFIGILPVVVLAFVLVIVGDPGNPVFVSPRVGLHGREFACLKIRSMKDAPERAGVVTTKKGDVRIIPFGRLIRRLKIDELLQLINIARGDMNFFGPRPNVSVETARYTEVEYRLLSHRPGLSDFASVAFADLGELLADYGDANLGYNQLVRRWKAMLSLHFMDTSSWHQRVVASLLTVVAVIHASWARQLLGKYLESDPRVDRQLVDVLLGRSPLVPVPPLGSESVVEPADLQS